MRTWMLAGATTLILAIGSQAAEARGGRGFGRLFSGHSHTSHRPIATTQPGGVRSEPKASTLSYQPTVVITPGRVASATAAGVALPALSLETPPVSRPITRPDPVEAVNPPAVQEARVLRPPCAPDRTVGGSGYEGTGFCLLN